MVYKKKKQLREGIKNKKVDGELFVEEKSVFSYKNGDPDITYIKKITLFPAIHNGSDCWLLIEETFSDRHKFFVKESILPYYEDEKK